MKIAHTLFPDSRVFERGPHRFEARGLHAGAQPQNCEVVQYGEAKFGNGTRNTHYLVRVNAVPVYIRICEAQAEAGGGEFAALEVCGGCEAAEAFDARILARLAALTRPTLKGPLHSPVPADGLPENG